MSLKDRENTIISYLERNKTATVEELCNVLYVSSPTVRRDLLQLEKCGKIIRTHGGAMEKQDKLGANIPIFLREKEHSDAKQIIAKKCASLVKDGDVIMLDGSTSALALIGYLAGKNVMVITNSAKACIMLASQKIKCFVCGGELQSNSLAFTGSFAEHFLGKFNADICFFSVRTLTADGLLTDNAIEENNVRRVILKQSKKKVLMLDSYKIAPACVNTLCCLEDIDVVACEEQIKDENLTAKCLFI